MDTASLNELLATFDTSADELENTLTPLLSKPLSTLTTKLPLLERAKLYTLTTYAILSLLFSTLRLNDIDAKAHPVFAELTRCRQYFEKIAEAEKAHENKAKGKGDERRLRIDKEAAARFVRAGVRHATGQRMDSVEGLNDRRSSKRKREETENEVSKFDEPADEASMQHDESFSAPAEEAPADDTTKTTKGRKRKKKKTALNRTPKSTGQAIEASVGKSKS